MDLTKLSKEVSYALRHAPEEYGLVLDGEGFVPIKELLDALNAKGEYERAITVSDLQEIIATSSKRRHEIVGDKIRALYGHSTREIIKKEIAKPPAVLYHGTTHEAAKSILKDGLKPMGRQRVHLSADIDTATSVGTRRDKNPVILEIEAALAFDNGVAFYKGNDKVWLSDPIPSHYVRQL